MAKKTREEKAEPIKPMIKGNGPTPEDLARTTVLNASMVKDDFTRDIAQRITLAWKLHNNSYTADGGYARDQMECFLEAFQDHPQPALWYPFALANYWGNDLQSWCDDILADGPSKMWS